MNSNEKILDENSIEDALEKLSKNLYLESPDLWIEFLDKINDKKYDEMVIFFACKYNYLDIVKYLIENTFIDLNCPSKNKSFKSIGDHLISTTNKNDTYSIYEYLNKIVESNTKSNTDVKLDSNFDQNNNKYGSSEIKNNHLYEPTFICPTCKTNIFKSGYKTLKSIKYKYSNDEKKPIVISENTLDSITCCNCNSVINDITESSLENLCSIQKCNNCGIDLTKCGIVDKINMIYDNDLNKFIVGSKSYNCANCENELKESQKEYFNL